AAHLADGRRAAGRPGRPGTRRGVGGRLAMPGTRGSRRWRRWRLVRARPEAVPTSLRRMYRRLPRSRSARPWAYGALAVAVLAALGWVVLATSVLGVRSVEVTGSAVATPEEVRAVAA